ncbi:hypothetical protein C474_13146 [Halogeometricum pallidum JCM 14848]|uniref:DUF7344 domain-containing protein n=1 Tax=Halogeometricum pallidum JCM 14848 TaxID=1227487 RepID=M0D5P1_HALPD|nr:hypothetical protein [Halogeometricum pallidum]ELZ29982.1 hypothetical protein C474_13146 [Halogeometricum pallidum JCM 14848]
MQDADIWQSVSKALGDKTRRRVLVALLELPNPDDTLSVPEDVDAGDRDETALETALYHNHLPLLEQAGYIRWDRDAGRVGVGDAFEEIRPVLRLLHDNRADLPDDWV